MLGITLNVFRWNGVSRMLRVELPRRATLAGITAFGSLLIGIGVAAFADAKSFAVNSTSDAVDANPGNGVCETTAGNGVCTLRAAIQEANATPGSNDIIVPAGTYALTKTGAAEDAAAAGD